MKILFLDTSSKYLSLAVAENNRLLAKTHRALDRRHSLQLVPLIDKILKKAGVPLKKIDGLCVGRGPGSFTGLRIGITCIKGLAFVLGRPVVAVPSLDILAQNVKRIKKIENNTDTLQVCTIVDARQSKVYTALYQSKNGKMARKSGYLLLTVEELLKRLTGKVIFLGDGLRIYAEKIRQAKKIKPFFAEEKYWYPQASRAISLGYQRLIEGKLEDINSLVPLYLYPKECQIKKVVGRRR